MGVLLVGEVGLIRWVGWGICLFGWRVGTMKCRKREKKKTDTTETRAARFFN